MPTTLASGHDVTRTGAPRRTDASLVGRLNAEWSRLCADPCTESAVARWAVRHPELSGCLALGDIEPAVSGAGAEQADRILLALLRLTRTGDSLAGRTVLQLMLGKAVRIAMARAGRDTRPSLEHTAVAALWTTIATYPIERRPAKVAANLAMETLRAVTTELTHQLSETPTSPDVLAADLLPMTPSGRTTADHELLDLLTWAVDEGTITAGDATLILDIYSPAPGTEGGAAAAERHGLSWPAARQRASRAVRKVAAHVRADVPAAA
jgi:hypothetical protein